MYRLEGLESDALERDWSAMSGFRFSGTMDYIAPFDPDAHKSIRRQDNAPTTAGPCLELRMARKPA